MMHTESMGDLVSKWTRYQQRTAGGKPRSLLVDALSYVPQKENVLDLGAGALNEAQFLLDEGFREVVALDITPQFRELDLPANARFIYVQKKLEEYEFPTDHFNLVSAQFILPFLPPNEFEKVWFKLCASLKSSGIFVGQLFAGRDDWFGDPEMTFHSKDEIEKLINKFDVLKCAEQEFTEKDARGKHWHYFDLIIRKRKGST